MILRENSEWLRYVLWGCAIGFCFLAVSAMKAPETDVGKLIGAVMGAFLFGFSGFVFKTHKIDIDPLRKTITITHKSLRHTFHEVIGFSDVERIVLMKTFSYDEDLPPANRWQERWSLALKCTDRIVPLTNNPAVSKKSAVHDAEKIQKILGTEISDSLEDSIHALANTGKKIEAITLVSRSLGKTTLEAKDHVDKYF